MVSSGGVEEEEQYDDKVGQKPLTAVNLDNHVKLATNIDMF